MKFLLDTHALWDHATGNREALPTGVVQALAVCLAKDLHFLDISLYELARHAASGRIHVADPLAGLIKLEHTYARLHSDPDIAWTAASLNWQKRHGQGEHLDPADRAILATAKLRDLTLVTADVEMHAFAPTLGVEVFW